MSIERYVLVDRNNIEQEEAYEDFQEAQTEAEDKHPELAVITQRYVLEDSQLAYTPDGSGVWPPAPAA